MLESLRRFVALDEAEVKPVDLARALCDAATLVRPSLPEGAQVVIDVPQDLPRVRCKPARISRIFLNLLQNSASAVDGAGRIVLRAHPRADHVVVTVQDNGRGIPQAHMAQLFDVGFTTKAGGRVGLRLGLPTSKRWVEELGGTLTVASREGEGTTVTVDLPLGGSRGLTGGACKP